MKTVAIAASGAAAAGVVANQRNIDTSWKPGAPAGVDPAKLKEEALANAPKYLQELVGAEIGPYRVESIGALHRGGIPVQLAYGDQMFRVDVLRADPSDQHGIGVVGSVTVFLRNGGNGSTATDEVMGLGAMALANELARRERDGWKPPAALMTLGERNALDSVRVG